MERRTYRIRISNNVEERMVRKAYPDNGVNDGHDEAGNSGDDGVDATADCGDDRSLRSGRRVSKTIELWQRKEELTIMNWLGGGEGGEVVGCKSSSRGRKRGTLVRKW